MKTRFIPLLAIAFSAAILGSCSDDDTKNGVPEPGDPQQIEFQITPPAFTRAQTDEGFMSEFEEGDAIGVFAVKRVETTQEYPSVADNYIQNAKLVYTAGEWILQGEELWFPTDGTKLDFYAYYPYVENADPTNIVYDASTMTNDLMTARKSGMLPNGKKVELNFKHKVALVQVENGNLSSAATVVMKGIQPKMRLDLSEIAQSNEAGEPDGGPADITLQKFEDGIYRAFIPAQMIDEETELFEFDDDGDISTHTLEKYVNFVANKAVVFEVAGVAKVDTKKQPNSYIAAPGSTVEIPAAKAYAMWNEDPVLKTLAGVDLSGEAAAQLLWQDVDGLVSSVTMEGSGRRGTIKAAIAPGKEGNAVIALKIGGTIRWSWHIWATSMDAEASAIVLNEASGVKMMDRPLGASTGTYNAENPDPRAMGLYFQWGRKDPIPMFKAYTDLTEMTLYGPNGTNPTLDKTGQAVKTEPVDNLSFTVMNPLSLITSSNDWFTTASSRYGEAANLWDDPDGSKSRFDPCPEGWRVPSYADFAELIAYSAAGNLPWIAEGYGRQGEKYGLFPANGYRGSGGSPSSVASAVAMWCREIGSGAHGYRVYMNNSGGAITAVGNGGVRVRGMGIRCVVDDSPEPGPQQ